MALEIERKFLVSEAPNLRTPFMAAAELVAIKQTYLAVPGPARVRVRRSRSNRTQGVTTYTRTAKTRITAAVKEEVEHEITQLEYRALLTLADPRRAPVRKTRRKFRWNGLLWELDQIFTPKELWILEVELDNVDDVHADLPLPPGISISREVTFETGWSNASLARASA